MIAEYLQIILLVSGIFTALALIICLFPNRFLKTVFNLEKIPAVYVFITRHWGLLVSLFGFFLIYAAFNEPVREVAMILASISKVVFAGMVMFGPLKQSRVFVRLATFDAIIVALFALYFAGV
jgi:hypothetical protein